MQTQNDISYGVIPYIKEEGVLKFLLIHQFSKMRGDTYWIFPKGHPEVGESEEETAMRELVEETSLKLASPLSEKTFTIEYDFIHEDTQTNKKVVYFLAEAASKEVVLQEEEVSEAGWFSYEEAREKITYESSKQLLDEVLAFLNDT